MLDTQVVKELLGEIGEGAYVGTSGAKMIDKLVGNFRVAEANDVEKFTCHMEEMFAARLFRAKDIRQS